MFIHKNIKIMLMTCCVFMISFNDVRNIMWLGKNMTFLKNKSGNLILFHDHQMRNIFTNYSCKCEYTDTLCPVKEIII